MGKSTSLRSIALATLEHSRRPLNTQRLLTLADWGDISPTAKELRALLVQMVEEGEAIASPRRGVFRFDPSRGGRIAVVTEVTSPLALPEIGNGRELEPEPESTRDEDLRAETKTNFDLTNVTGPRGEQVKTEKNVLSSPMVDADHPGLSPKLWQPPTSKLDRGRRRESFKLKDFLGSRPMAPPSVAEVNETMRGGVERFRGEIWEELETQVAGLAAKEGATPRPDSPHQVPLLFSESQNDELRSVSSFRVRESELEHIIPIDPSEGDRLELYGTTSYEPADLSAHPAAHPVPVDEPPPFKRRGFSRRKRRTPLQPQGKSLSSERDHLKQQELRMLGSEETERAETERVVSDSVNSEQPLERQCWLVLKVQSEVISLEHLAQLLNEDAEDDQGIHQITSGLLRTHLIKVDLRRSGRGLLPLFHFNEVEKIGLYEWCLTPARQALELQLETTLEALQEQTLQELRVALTKISGEDFEELVTVLLRLQGYRDLHLIHQVYPGRSALRGVDPLDQEVLVMIESDGRPIEVKTVQALTDQLPAIGVERGVLLTLAPLTAAAAALFEHKAQTISYLDGHRLVTALCHHGVAVTERLLTLPMLTLPMIDGALVESPR